jgi:phenylalanyl-tRNA synthetase beta subunit
MRGTGGLLKQGTEKTEEIGVIGEIGADLVKELGLNARTSTALRGE